MKKNSSHIPAWAILEHRQKEKRFKRISKKIDLIDKESLKEFQIKEQIEIFI